MPLFNGKIARNDSPKGRRSGERQHEILRVSHCGENRFMAYRKEEDNSLLKPSGLNL
jgi:hypothetical protein